MSDEYKKYEPVAKPNLYGRLLQPAILLLYTGTFVFWMLATLLWDGRYFGAGVICALFGIAATVVWCIMMDDLNAKNKQAK